MSPVKHSSNIQCLTVPILADECKQAVFHICVGSVQAQMRQSRSYNSAATVPASTTRAFSGALAAGGHCPDPLLLPLLGCCILLGKEVFLYGQQIV